MVAQEGMALWAEWMFYAAAATTLLTFIALVAIIRTLHHTRRAADSAENMLTQTEKSTAAAISASVAATDAVRMERAWMTWNRVRHGPIINSMINNIPVQNGLCFFVDFVNSGRTSAIAVKHYSSYRLIGVDEDTPTFEWQHDEDAPFGVVAVGDGLTGRIILNDEEADDVKNKRVRLILYVHVQYFDVFSNPETDPPHESQACILVNHQGGFVADGSGNKMEAIDFGNTGPQNTAT